VKFGDKITNVCASENNPMLHSYYVRRSKNDIKCTDRKGNFWDVSKQVIFLGHLPYNECEKLYKPIWKKQYDKLT